MPKTVNSRSRVLCAAVLVSLAVFAMAASSASAGGKFDTRSWMEDLFDGSGRTIEVGKEVKPASEVKLGQLAIPGSHDSTAEHMNHFADECADPGYFQREFGVGLTQRYARTQHHDLYTQARLGIRSFDIRPYYTGSELRTCHTLDAGTLRSAFEGEGGLDRFLRENSKEVVIVNLSHFQQRRGDEGKFKAGIDAMADYLLEEVCPDAIDPAVVAEPGAVTLKTMWKEGKHYVVVLDHDLYEKLAPRLGGNKCVYDASEGVSGGYAGEQRRVSYESGKASSTNLWNGILDELGCEPKLFVRCNYGERGLENPDTVRRATEKILFDKFKEGHKSLHETSYIWVYGDFAGFGDIQAANFRFDCNDSSLVAATDERRLLVNDGVFSNTYVNAGLKPFARDFIERLGNEADLKKTGVGVGVVNMDAIGRDNTFEEFVKPLLVIDRQILTR